MNVFVHGAGVVAPKELSTAEIGGREHPAGFLPRELESEIRSIHESYPRCDRAAILAIAAGRRAVAAAGWSTVDAVLVGSSRGATDTLERAFDGFRESGKVPVRTSPLTTLGNLSSWLAQDLGIGAPLGDLSVTCSTSLHAVYLGAALLRSGMASRVLAGGAEAPLTPFTVAQMEAIGVYSKRVGDPYPCRPFEAVTRGNSMVVSEAAGVVALSSEPSPVSVAGIGVAMERISSPTSVSRYGTGIESAMRRALDGVGDRGVDLIVMHAPGTVQGDAGELGAVRSIWGELVPHLIAPKWRFGHSFGASGTVGMELAVRILAGEDWREELPPYENHLPRHIRDSGPIRSVMVNGFGFGGNACSLVLTKNTELSS